MPDLTALLSAAGIAPPPRAALDELDTELTLEMTLASQLPPPLAGRVVLAWFLETASEQSPAGDALRALLMEGIW